MANNLGNKEIMAQNIKYYMAQNDVDRKTICNALDVNYATFSDWVNARTYPRIDKIELMAHYFGISKADLVEPRDPRKPNLDSSKLYPVLGTIAAGSPLASYNELNTMMQQPDTGETSLLELYDYCEQVKDWGLDWADKVDAMTNDDTAEYAEAAGTYVKAVAYGIATPLMEYIDENKMEDLSDANETLGLMPAYFLEVESARSAYLSNSGLSEEEIQQQFDLS